MGTTPAAQYLRRSTEHQEYSLENQTTKIREFAEQHNFAIIRTYSDGKTGLVLKHRAGLRQLLQDVMNGRAPYKAILVYDVSRWGRFQDTDEPAHYEFLCRSAGIPVHYCAETFLNDGSMPSLIMKALKRGMAGEYSRELSVKVSEGLRRLARLGFKQGGVPGYGYRRMLLSNDGIPKQTLKFGERKSIATDRVVLVPGPKEEIDVIRQMYRMFVWEKRSIAYIMRDLNRKGIKYVGGLPWKYGSVRNVLVNIKYTGCQVFGRTSQKLCTPCVRMPKDQWAMKPKAFEPIIDKATFDAAQKRLTCRPQNQSDEQLLDRLRKLLARKGRLSTAIINRSRAVPGVSTYRKRFGALTKAYELIGYGRPQDFMLQADLRRRTNAVREQLVNRLRSMYPGYVSVVGQGTRWRSLLQLPGFHVSVQIGRARKSKTGMVKWFVDPAVRESDVISLLVRLKPNNGAIQDLHLFPCIKAKWRFRLKEDDQWFQKGVRLENLNQFYEAATRMNAQKQSMKTSAPDRFF